MKIVQKISGLLLLLTLAFVLTACGASLQKPTGLDNQVKEPIPVVDLPTDEVVEAVDAVEEVPSEVATTEADIAKDSRAIEATPSVPTKQPSAEKPAPTRPAVEERPASTHSEIPFRPAEKSVAQPTEQLAPKSVPQPQPNVKPAPNPIEQPASVEKPVAKPNPSPAPAPKPNVNPAPVPTPIPPVEQPAAPAKSKIVYSIVISPTEVPLPPTSMEIKDGDTVLAALIDITRKHKVQMDYRGGQGATAYVEGMDNVYEFDRGQGSGWMYRVNGIFPDRGAGVVPLLDGDRVEWLYTTNLGVDLNADLKPFRR